jgi:hypothetical protein
VQQDFEVLIGLQLLDLHLEEVFLADLGYRHEFLQGLVAENALPSLVNERYLLVPLIHCLLVVVLDALEVLLVAICDHLQAVVASFEFDLLCESPDMWVFAWAGHLDFGLHFLLVEARFGPEKLIWHLHDPTEYFVETTPVETRLELVVEKLLLHKFFVHCFLVLRF